MSTCNRRGGALRWWAFTVVWMWVLINLFLDAGAAHAQGFYIEGGMSMLEKRSVPEPQVFTWQSMDCGSYWCVAGPPRSHMFYDLHRYDINEVRNPYGSAAIGYDYAWRSLRVDFQLRHESSIATGKDRGTNAARLTVRWYLFGGR